MPYKEKKMAKNAHGPRYWKRVIVIVLFGLYAASFPAVGLNSLICFGLSIFSGLLAVKLHNGSVLNHTKKVEHSLIAYVLGGTMATLYFTGSPFLSVMFAGALALQWIALFFL
jgi:hypothetical protein